MGDIYTRYPASTWPRLSLHSCWLRRPPIAQIHLVLLRLASIHPCWTQPAFACEHKTLHPVSIQRVVIVSLPISFPQHYLWRAVNQDGDVVDVYLQAKRDENSRAEQSHEAPRVRERGLQRFKSVGQAQRFLGAHAAVSTHSLANRVRFLHTDNN